MMLDDLPSKLLDTLTQHLPPGSAWVPVAGAGVAAALGLLLMVKGARLAPMLAGVVFAFLGGLAGSFLPQLAGVPLWPAIILSAVVGLVVGIVLFRVWFALLVAGCLILGSLTLYGVQVLRGPLNDYFAAGLDEHAGLVTLPPPGDGAVEPGGQPEALAGLAPLWSYLGQHVPAFHTSLLAISIATGLSGLVFALLLPRAARAFWAATLGTALFLPALYAVAHACWPAAASWLAHWGLIIAALLWSASLVYNLTDIIGVRPRKPPAEHANKAAA